MPRSKNPKIGPWTEFMAWNKKDNATYVYRIRHIGGPKTGTDEVQRQSSLLLPSGTVGEVLELIKSFQDTHVDAELSPRPAGVVGAPLYLIGWHKIGESEEHMAAEVLQEEKNRARKTEEWMEWARQQREKEGRRVRTEEARANRRKEIWRENADQF